MTARAVKRSARKPRAPASPLRLSSLGFPECGTQAAGGAPPSPRPHRPRPRALRPSSLSPCSPSPGQQSRAPTRGMPPEQPPWYSPGVSTATAGLPRPPRRPAARLTIRRAPIGFGTGSASQSARAHAPLARRASSLGPRGMRAAGRASVNLPYLCIWALELLWAPSARLRLRPLFPTTCNIWESRVWCLALSSRSMTGGVIICYSLGQVL